MKCPDLPKLCSYEGAANSIFWKSFPSSKIPSNLESNVNILKLEEIILECESFLTSFEVNRALQAVSKILNSELAPAKLLIFLLVFAKNSSNCSKYGVEITDTIANWSPKGFVAGAFKAPPLSNYRVNPLMAVDQGKKIRPVLNVSLPENASFNDNINFFEMEKVSMSTARRFGFSLCEAGYFAKMSKFNLVDAYKIIPAPLNDFRLQGFCWLQKYFVELKQIFGAKTAVANFDIFGNTILSLWPWRVQTFQKTLFIVVWMTFPLPLPLILPGAKF